LQIETEFVSIQLSDVTHFAIDVTICIRAVPELPMTTAVVVKANHGWPVDVTRKDPKSGELLGPVERVEANTERTFYIHNGMDIHVHEVQAYDTSVAAG
jgi:hypothetical protein